MSEWGLALLMEPQLALLLAKASTGRDVHRGVAQVARATAHMPFSTHVALPRWKKNK